MILPNIILVLDEQAALMNNIFEKTSIRLTGIAGSSAAV
jgi:hypothetical protein